MLVCIVKHLCRTMVYFKPLWSPEFICGAWWSTFIEFVSYGSYHYNAQQSMSNKLVIHNWTPTSVSYNNSEYNFNYWQYFYTK